jgi:hypothetical protein
MFLSLIDTRHKIFFSVELHLEPLEDEEKLIFQLLLGIDASWRQSVFSRWIPIPADASQFLAGLKSAPPPMLLLHLPQLLHPSHGFGPDRALCVIEPCVLAKVPVGVIDMEPLCWFGLSWRRRCFGWALLWWWICGLVDGVTLRGCLERLGVRDLWWWWGGSGLMVGGGVGYLWIILVVIRLDVSVDSFSSVVSPGLSSSLGHGGRQMLG